MRNEMDWIILDEDIKELDVTIIKLNRTTQAEIIENEVLFSFSGKMSNKIDFWRRKLYYMGKMLI